VKNGGAEWIEGRRKPVEVVCVDKAMIAGAGERVGRKVRGRRRKLASIHDRVTFLTSGIKRSEQSRDSRRWSIKDEARM